jgi:hypothetical protein
VVHSVMAVSSSLAQCWRNEGRAATEA